MQTHPSSLLLTSFQPYRHVTGSLVYVHVSWWSKKRGFAAAMQQSTYIYSTWFSIKFFSTVSVFLHPDPLSRCFWRRIWNLVRDNNLCYTSGDGPDGLNEAAGRVVYGSEPSDGSAGRVWWTRGSGLMDPRFGSLFCDYFVIILNIIKYTQNQVTQIRSHKSGHTKLGHTNQIQITQFRSHNWIDSRHTQATLYFKTVSQVTKLLGRV